MRKILIFVFFVFTLITLVGCSDNQDDYNDYNYSNNSGNSSNVVQPSAIHLTPINLVLYVGQGQYLYESFTPTNTTNKTVYWKSANTSIATVSNLGYVTAKKVGSTQITATTANGKVATCNVTVLDNKNYAFITAFNALSYFSVSVTQGSSFSSTYNFNVSVSMDYGVSIESLTMITVEVELEISYKTSGSYLTQKKTFDDKVNVTFMTNSYSSTMRGTASIYVPSYAVPSTATITGAMYSYNIYSASGKVSY